MCSEDMEWLRRRRQKVTEDDLVDAAGCSVRFDETTQMLYAPRLCDWSDRVWLARFYRLIHDACTSNHSCHYFAVTGHEANGHIVELLIHWGFHRMMQDEIGEWVEGELFDSAAAPF